MSGRLLVLPDWLGKSPLVRLMEIHVFARDGRLPGWFPQIGEPMGPSVRSKQKTLVIPSVLALLHTDFCAEHKGPAQNRRAFPLFLGKRKGSIPFRVTIPHAKPLRTFAGIVRF
jgi:hypothetical protein